MPKHEDFLGQELNIGDTVVVAITHGKNSGASLTRGVITKLTDKMVYLDGTTDYTGYTNGLRKTSLSKVVKIST